MLENTIAFVKNKQAFAAGFLFSAASILLGIWVAAIPGIATRLHLSHSALGFSLLMTPLGAFTGVALSTKIFSRLPVGKWLLAGHLFFCLVIIMQVTAPNRFVFWLALYLHGLVGFLNGVSVNAVVDMLEKKYNKRIMSSCHGMYSIGGGIGAGMAAFLFSVQLTSSWQVVIVALTIASILFSIKSLLLGHKEIIHSGSSLRIPSSGILGISVICLVLFMAEGCVADWSAIYLRESLQSSKEWMSLGYAGFSVAMTIGRFNGDRLIAHLGSRKIVIAGCIVAAAGFVLVSLAVNIIMAVGGFVLVGFGCSCIVPVLFSTSANIPGLSPVEGFAMVTTGGLIGFLAGPSVIGIISEKINLSSGFAFVFLLITAAMVIAMKNRFLNKSNGKVITNTTYNEQFL